MQILLQTIGQPERHDWVAQLNVYKRNVCLIKLFSFRCLTSDNL